MSRRVIDLALKRAVVARVEAGEKVLALGRELGVHRQVIYKWLYLSRAGELGVRGRGRPTTVQALERQAVVERVEPLAAAERRIADLERKVGQQAVELDFFQGALRRIKASRRPNDGPGATGSSPRSKR